MNICIITVFNSANQGSFQQLKELGDAYSKYGKVYYLDAGIRRVFSGTPTYFIKCLCKLKFKKAFFELKKKIIFQKRYRSLSRITADRIDEMDLFVLGSDEIWNYNRADMRNEFLYGVGLNSKKVSYAPSVGNTDVKSFLDAPKIRRSIGELDLLSVRDEHSRNVITELGYDRDVDITVDPTFLKKKEQYVSECTYDYGHGYVALYCFQGVLDKAGISSSWLVNYAKSRNLKLVSGGIWSDYADENLHPYSSGTFDYYLNADCVITNTFHGTAFAINFNKRFITFSCGKEKITNLLKQFGLEDRDCTQKTEKQIMEMLDTPIDYSSVNSILSDMRDSSLDFISRSIDVLTDTEKV
ncbi:MAG: polysaccharide pyruvyl transferase family protein [Clostridia bacterium]|nr:polysaccharide pyruvyl transferase family protein [Clostridia bacterium]